MAVTLSKTFKPEFCLSSLSGCIGGGEDYRTINGSSSVVDGLYTYGFQNENISEACMIQEITMSFQARIRTKYDGITSLTGKLKNGLGSWNATNKDYGWKIDYLEHEVGSSSDWANMAGQASYPTGVSAKGGTHMGVRMTFSNSNLSTIRIYIRNVSFTIIRTRACYITFKGDGVTEKTVTQDYGTIPSFGSTPTRDGYTFKGWSNGTTTYSGTLPTAYEQDVTYTAVWELAFVKNIYIGTTPIESVFRYNSITHYDIYFSAGVNSDIYSIGGARKVNDIYLRYNKDLSENQDLKPI